MPRHRCLENPDHHTPPTRIANARHSCQYAGLSRCEEGYTPVGRQDPPPKTPGANQLCAYAAKHMSGNNDGMVLLRHIADRHETPRQAPPRMHNCAAQNKRIHKTSGLGGSRRHPPAPEATGPNKRRPASPSRIKSPVQTPKRDNLQRHILLAT